MDDVILKKVKIQTIGKTLAAIKEERRTAAIRAQEQLTSFVEDQKNNRLDPKPISYIDPDLSSAFQSSRKHGSVSRSKTPAATNTKIKYF